MNRKTKFQMLSFRNRYEYTGLIQEIEFEQMYKAFKKNVIRTKETALEYAKGDKEFRDKCKDKGGFIMGTSVENKRSKTSILTRNMVSLDLDYCPKNIMDILEEESEQGKLDFRFFVYSTHSYTADKPRLRIIVPLTKDVQPEEYEAIALRLCSRIGMEYFDATTAQANRIMYYPTVSVDGDYVCKMFGNEQYFDLDPDEILKEYFDYHNIDEWQRPLYFEGKRKDKFDKNTTPDSTKTKYRVVNSFNMEYSITEALDFFLQDVYKKESNNRYTFIGGESKNGLHILNPQYAFSFHGTDPAQGKLLSSFDIVRIHKFGKQDNENEQYLEENYSKTSSFREMCDWIKRELPNVMVHDPKIKEQKEKVKEQLEERGVKVSTDWIDKLIRDNNGDIKKLPYNISLIIANDPSLKGLFFYDTIKQQVCFEKAPFWDSDIRKGDGARDLDFSHIRNYLSQPPYLLSGKDAIEDGVLVEAYKKKINYPKYFLSKLPEWDGVKRCETLFIDLFGVKDCEFVREASKKWLTALVARIIKPGTKFDYVIALLGSVGIGKSTFGKSLICMDWNGKMEDIENYDYFFSDKEIDLRNERDTIDAIRGICVLELAEFDKFLTKYDKATLKSFITKTKDRFIERYGKRTIDVPRSFVFIATSNEAKPIKNPEDERRFMPFYCNLPKHKALVFDHNLWNREIRDQVLAEAMHYYYTGYSFSAPFPPKMQKQWDALIESASLENDYYGIVKDYVENKFPVKFLKKSFDDMKDEWRDRGIKEEYAYREVRNTFCVKEIWCLALDKRKGDTIDFFARKEIEQSLKKLGFEKNENSRKSFGDFGQQYYFEKKSLEDIKREYSVKSQEDLKAKVEEINRKEKEGISTDDEIELRNYISNSLIIPEIQMEDDPSLPF